MNAGKVNIIGKGAGWGDAPMNEYSWGITQLYLWRPTDLVIDMNVYYDNRWGATENDHANLTRKLCEEKGVEYVDLGNYPIKEIMHKFDTDYFSSTVDYAIALAIYREYKEIHLYGVSMLMGDYYDIKCGCDFWCGYAKGLGINLTVHGVTRVMKTKDGLVYGYDTKQGDNL